MSEQDAASISRSNVDQNENAQQEVVHAADIINKFIAPHVVRSESRHSSFNVHGKSLKYAHTSLYLFPKTSKIRLFALWLSESVWFERFIIAVILMNTIMLALQDYSFRSTDSEAPASWTDSVEYVFTVVFILEFLLKIVSMGFVMEARTYLRDGWNLIDFIVVVTSFVSFFVSARFSAIRVIRIMRPLRSINSMKGMRVLVSTLLNALPALGNVVVFLMFIIILFGILGLQLFMGALESRCRLTPQPIDGKWPALPNYHKLCSDNESCPGDTYCGNMQTAGLPEQDEQFPELNFGYTNFDNIINATFTIFQALTTEGWTVIVFIYKEAVTPAIVYLYFLLLIFVGAFFVVNLILAVINESFLEASENVGSAQLSTAQVVPLEQLTSSQAPLVAQRSNSQAQLPPNDNQQDRVDEDCFTKFKKMQIQLQQIIEGKIFLGLITLIIIMNTITLSLDRYPISNDESSALDTLNQVFTVLFCLEMALKMLAYGVGYVRDSMNLFDAVIVLLSVIEWILTSQGNDSSGGSFSAIQAFRTLRLFRLFKLARTWVSFRKLLFTIAATIAGITNFVILLLLFMVVASLLGMELFAYRVDTRYNFNSFFEAMLSVFLLLTNEGWNTMAYEFMHQLDSVGPLFYFVIVIIFGNFILLKLFIAILLFNFAQASNQEEDSIDLQDKTTVSKKTSVITPEAQLRPSFMNSTWRSKPSPRQSTVQESLEGTSLFIFGPYNKYRIAITRLTKNKYFDYFILFVIVFSSILLALDDPLTPAMSIEFIVIDIIITVIFIFEAALKIISTGFIINGRESYLWQPANILDLVVIVFSSLNFDPNSSSQFSKIKVLRVIRVLRPLRLILRNEDLKLAINALFKSMAQMLNITMICLIFFLLFGIFGVTQFKGTYFYCDIEANDMHECFDVGGNWVNKDYNFDNVLNAMIQLFILATTEGWIDLMSSGVDSRGIGLNPEVNSQPIWALYFVLFIIVGSFFIINLFGGVIVDAFSQEKEKLTGSHDMSSEELDWIHIQQELYIVRPQPKFKSPQNKYLKALYKIINSKRFEEVILVCIILNTIVLMVQFARAPDGVTIMIQSLNWIFLSIFTIEAGVKILVYKMHYFQSGWNVFDFVVVMLTLFGVVLEQSNLLSNVGTATSMLRTFRIFRVLRLVKSAKNLRIIFQTFLVTLPGLMSVGALLLIMLFIFAIVFLNLYPYVKFGAGITENSNFSEFGLSLFTLFKCSTGEDWNLVMADAARSIQPNNVCYDIADYDTYKLYGLNGCGNIGAFILMIVFMIIISLIMLNLFVAIIIEGFQNASKEESLVVKKVDLEAFQLAWMEFDRNATFFIQCKYFTQFMCTLPQPLGWQDTKKKPRQQRMETSQLRMPVYVIKDKQCYFWYDVLYALSFQQVIQNAPNQDFQDSQHNQQVASKAHELKETAYKQLTNPVSEFDSALYVACTMLQKKFKSNYVPKPKMIPIPNQITNEEELEQFIQQ